MHEGKIQALMSHIIFTSNVSEIFVLFDGRELPVVSTLLMLLVAFDPSMSTLPIIVLWLNFVCVAVALLGFVWLAHSLRDYTWDAIICFAGSFFEI